jgi:type IV pilus assembly protein PilC
MLKMPIFGVLVDKSCVARWTRTCPPCLQLASRWWKRWTRWAAPPAIRSMKDGHHQDPAGSLHRHRLTAAMTNANLFPSMVLQMCAIGEESGSIDHMLGKAADFYEPRWTTWWPVSPA